MWIEVAAIAFAVVFLVVGILRTVEFSGLELSKPKHALFVILHVIGCLLFAAALILVAMDLRVQHRTLAFVLFVSALVVLAPGQFTIGMKRRRASEK